MDYHPGHPAETDGAYELGRVRLEPSGDILAGTYGTLRLTYTAGSRGVAPGGGLCLGTDTDTDWGIPQTDDPTAAEYLSVSAPEGVAPVLRAYRMTDVRVTFRGRALAPGEEAVLTIGDRAGGGPGSRAQTAYERQHYWDVSVDLEGHGHWVALPDRPCVAVRGADAVALVAVAPSVVAEGEPFRLLIRAQDAWGNPSSTYRGRVRVSLPGGNVPVDEVNFGAESDGVVILEGCRLDAGGMQRAVVEEVDGHLRAESNPISCGPQTTGRRLYWGEPHGGQLHMPEKIAEFFRYARDVSGLDFCGYQANDHRLSTREWAIQQQAESEAYRPGRFVPLPGFEWSAEPPEGGHHNVYFRRFGRPIRRSCHLANIAGQGDEDTDLTHVRDLHDAYRGSDTIITPHVGGGRADLSWHDPTLEPAIEVTSTHGTFEWFLRDALRRRCRVGFVGGSDGYTGRPGGEYPGFIERRFAKGGYTALFADELTVPGVIAALRERRAYATTGARMLVVVDVAGASMGAEATTDGPPTISGLVCGTAPLEAIEVYRGLDLIHTHPLDLRPRRGVLRVLWEGAAHRDSYSAVIWDGNLVTGCGQGGDRPGFRGPLATLRFDSPRCWVEQEGEGALRWHAVTCGYRSGFLAPLEPLGEDGWVELALRSSLATMSAFGGFGDASPKRMSYTPMETLRCRIALADLDRGPVTFELGALDRRVTLSWAPGATDRDLRFAYTDPEPLPGVNPYWLRVVQQDQEMAWTSPVFVDWAREAN